MSRRAIGFIFAAVFLFISSFPAWVESSEMTPSELAQTNYGTSISKKLGRGLSNIAFGWIDLLKGIDNVGQENNTAAAVTWGPLYGAGQAVVRTLAGAYEVATFPIPYPKNFEPLVQPEFVLDSHH